MFHLYCLRTPLELLRWSAEYTVSDISPQAFHSLTSPTDWRFHVITYLLQTLWFGLRNREFPLFVFYFSSQRWMSFDIFSAFDLLFWNISSAVLIPAQVFHPYRDKIRGQQRHQWQCKCTVLKERSGPLPVLNPQSIGCFFFISTWFCIVLCELHLSTMDHFDHVVMTTVLKPKALSQLGIKHGAEPNRTPQARSVTSLCNNKCVVI